MTPFETTNRETSPYGWRTINGKRDNHRGFDVVPTKYPGQVLPESAWRTRLCNAGQDGGMAVVDYIGYDSARGKYVDVLIRTAPRKVWERHQHMQSIVVQKGQRVAQGTVLGVAGNTGFSSGRHLHIGIYVGGKTESNAVNPAAWVDLPNKAGTYEGNSTMDGAAAQPPVLYNVTVSRASAGDRDKVQTLAKQLGLAVDVRAV